MTTKLLELMFLLEGAKSKYNVEQVGVTVELYGDKRERERNNFQNAYLKPHYDFWF